MAMYVSIFVKQRYDALVIDYITMIVVIVGIGEKFYEFLKFCTLENNLAINLTQKIHFKSIKIAVIMLRLSKTKQKIKYFDVQQMFLRM